MEDIEYELIQHCMEDLSLSRLEFPRRFYERLFRRAPEIEKLFTKDRTRQSLMLYAVMAMVVSCMRSGKDVSGELGQFGRRHARVGVREEMFPIFGQAFIDTMVEFLPHRHAEVLERAWTPTFARISTGVIAGTRNSTPDSPLFRPDPKRRSNPPTCPNRAGNHGGKSRGPSMAPAPIED